MMAQAPIDLRRYRAVFLDGFSTLFDLAGVPERAAAAAAEILEIEDVEGFGKRWMAHSAAQDWGAGPFQPIRRHFTDSLRRTLDELGMTGDVDACVNADIALIQKVPLYPRASDLLRRLRDVLPVALVSNADDDFVRPILERDALAFDAVVTSESCRAYKPDARVFVRAAEAVGCRPQEALMIGDSWAEDVRGAVAVGARSVWVNRRGETAKTQDVARSLYLGEAADLGEVGQILGL